MNLSLTPELKELIQRKLETGQYLSASGVVREALLLLDERDRLQAQVAHRPHTWDDLRLLEKWDRLHAIRLEEMRRELQVGIDQADRGEVAPLDVRGTLANVRERRKAGRLKETQEA
jgi:antitoxin ParD1/3/4